MSATLVTPKTTSGGEIIRELVNASDGQGLNFDGAAGYIDIASPPDLGTKASFELVISAETASQTAYIFDFGSGGRTIFGLNSGSLRFYSGGWSDFSVLPLDDLKVHHICVTVDGTAAVLYDNGNQVATATLAASLNADSAADLKIGSHNDGSADFFNGTIYRARFYNRTLSADDVRTAYQRADVPVADQYGSQTIVIPGDFDGDLDGWDSGNTWNSQTNPSNNMVLAASNTNQYCRTAVTLTKGFKYRVTYTASSLTGSPFFAYAQGGSIAAIPATSGSTTITAGTKSAEFTLPDDANPTYFYIASGTASDAVTLDNVSVVRIGVVVDMDLAFASPTQSLTVQDRSGAADGTCSASGVTQVQKVVQGNLTSLAVTTSQQAAGVPADGAIIADKVGIGDTPASLLTVQGAGTNTATGIGAAEVMLNVKNTTASTHSAIVINALDGQDAILYFSENGAERWNIRNDASDGDKFNIRDGANTRLAINSTGQVTVNEPAGNTTNSTKLEVRSDADGSTSAIRTTNKDTTAGTNQAAGVDFGLSRNSGAFKPQAGQIKVGRESDWDASDTNIDSYMAFSTYGNNALGERLRIASDGEVKVIGSGSTGAILRLENTEANAAADDIAGTVNFYTNDASVPAGGRVCGYIRSVADDQYNRYGLRFGTANYNETVAERMSIDASGTTTFQKTDGAAVNLKRNDSDVLDGDTFGRLQAISGDSNHTAGTEVGSIVFKASGDQTGTRPVGQMSFEIANNTTQAEAMRIEPTKLVKFYGGIAQGGTSGDNTAYIDTSGQLYISRPSGTGRNHIIIINDGSTVGSITSNASATQYNTSSDYRLKENLEPLTGALDRINQLPVYRFNFKADPDTTVDGFVAHEVQAHVPEAITGEKDGMRTVVVQEAVEAVEAVAATYWEEGDELPEGVAVGDEKTAAVEAVEAVEEVTEEQPDYQGIDQSKLVPLLVAAVKELKAKVETLENA